MSFFLIHGSQHFLIKNEIILSTVFSYIYNALSIELSNESKQNNIYSDLWPAYTRPREFVVSFSTTRTHSLTLFKTQTHFESKMH